MSAKVQIKTQDIINWIFDGPQDIPQVFFENRTKLASVIPYVTESLWNLPKVILFMNRHTNDLFNIPDPIELLYLIRKLVRHQGISRRDLRFSRFSARDTLIDDIIKNLGYDEGNASAKALMIRHRSADDTIYKKIAPTKANLKKMNDPRLKKEIDNIIKEHREKNKPAVDKSHYINDSDLTQEFIDEHELVLFDTSLLKKSNKVLLIFIDKNNHKKYCLKPFKATFFISTKDGVINNDYIEELNPDKFMGYTIHDVTLYNRLKYMLNSSYKNIINNNT